MLADKPVSIGGADAGPAPLDFVLAGLGASTSLTLRVYAERKGIALSRISVSLSHDKVKVAGIPRDRIVRRIMLEGDLTAGQRARLLEIANRCPVHRALAQPLVIASELVD